MFDTPAGPPQTGLEPPTAPVITLFLVLEQNLGRGEWLYHQLLQILLAGARFGQSANEEMLRQVQFRLQTLSGGIAGSEDALLAALSRYVDAALELSRSVLRVGEAARNQNEVEFNSHLERGTAAAHGGIGHLDAARLLLESIVGRFPAGDVRRTLPSYVTVLQLELENQLQVMELTSVSMTSREVGRYLETASQVAEAHRDIGRRIAGLGIPDAGVEEMAQNMDRMGDMVEESAAAVRRMSQADLKYMPLLGDRVFLIHGHAPDYQAVKEILTKLGFGDRITVLKEEPNRGQTVLDKFITHAGRACMAVALVTPDDVVSEGTAATVKPGPTSCSSSGGSSGGSAPRRCAYFSAGARPCPPTWAES